MEDRIEAMHKALTSFLVQRKAETSRNAAARICIYLFKDPQEEVGTYCASVWNMEIEDAYEPTVMREGASLEDVVTSAEREVARWIMEQVNK